MQHEHAHCACEQQFKSVRQNKNPIYVRQREKRKEEKRKTTEIHTTYIYVHTYIQQFEYMRHTAAQQTAELALLHHTSSYIHIWHIVEFIHQVYARWHVVRNTGALLHSFLGHAGCSRRHKLQFTGWKIILSRFIFKLNFKEHRQSDLVSSRNLATTSFRISCLVSVFNLSGAQRTVFITAHD